MPFAFHKRCGSPQWWWLHKSSNTCCLSDLWETSKSYLLNCNESRLCLWLSRQRVQFPDPLVMRYDIRLSYHRDFTLFPKIALVQWWNNFQNIPRSFGWRPWQVLLRASGPKLTVFPPTARRWNQKNKQMFSKQIVIRGPKWWTLHTSSSMHKFIFNDNFLDPVSKTRWLFSTH